MTAGTGRGLSCEDLQSICPSCNNDCGRGVSAHYRDALRGKQRAVSVAWTGRRPLDNMGISC